MPFWETTFTGKALILDLAMVSALLLAGTVARRYSRLFQAYLIPKRPFGN